MPLVDSALAQAIASFNQRGQLGPDPLAARYPERRAAWSLFARQLGDGDIEALRPYIFPYATVSGSPARAAIPSAPSAAPIAIHNFIDGAWREAKSGERAALQSPADKRVTLFTVPASGPGDVDQAVSAGDAVWKSLAWADEGLGYRKQVIKNVSRIINHFVEEMLHEIRQQIPKTRLEAEKDSSRASAPAITSRARSKRRSRERWSRR